jgi:hypothetical protein
MKGDQLQPIDIQSGRNLLASKKFKNLIFPKVPTRGD